VFQKCRENLRMQRETVNQNFDGKSGKKNLGRNERPITGQSKEKIRKESGVRNEAKKRKKEKEVKCNVAKQRRSQSSEQIKTNPRPYGKMRKAENDAAGRKENGAAEKNLSLR